MIILLAIALLYLWSVEPVASALSYIPGIIAALASGVAVVLGAVNKVQIAAAARKIESVKRTGEAIHTLSNSAMGAQLQTNVATLEALSVVMHRLAVNGTEADKAAAAAVDIRVAAAKKEYTDHLTKQAVVDATTHASGPC